MKVNGFVQMNANSVLNMAETIICGVEEERAKSRQDAIKYYKEEAAKPRLFGLIKGKIIETDEGAIAYGQDIDDWCNSWKYLYADDMKKAKQMKSASLVAIQEDTPMLVNASFIRSYTLYKEKGEKDES